ncbi:MAG TPA: hypothetical protein VGQ36_07975 [Thermoanaerobaculia bacterium]|jgi:hypothetical protein|nr:hypothetical protein [Thermoanaerobaculia bacterium]
MSKLARSILVISCLLMCAWATAAERGEGAIVIEDAPVYDSSTATESRATLKRGESVAALTGDVQNPEYSFPRNEERVHVAWFPSEFDLGTFDVGWIDARHFSRFTYPCCCGADPRGCSPLYAPTIIVGQLDWAWNGCFQQARDAKLKSLQAPAVRPQERTAGGRQDGAPSPSAVATLVQRLNPNTDIISFDGKPIGKKASFSIDAGEHVLIVEATLASVTREQTEVALIRLAITFSAEPGKEYWLTGGMKEFNRVQTPTLTEWQKVGRIKRQPRRAWSGMPEVCAGAEPL